jgi:hypothetical protein
MKRISIAVVALAACLMVALVPAATAKKKKVKTFAPTITLAVAVTPATAGSPGSPGDQYTPAVPAVPATPGAGRFSGQVSSGGPSGCESSRPVTVFRNGIAVTQVTTNGSGAYTVTVAARPPAGTYTATVPKKVIKKKNKKTGKIIKKKCLPGTSNAVPVA